jgi:adenylate kinase
MMRAERASGSELGKKFDEFMSQGKLVPDSLVLDLDREGALERGGAEGRHLRRLPAHGPAGRGARRHPREARDGKIDHVVAIEVNLDIIIDRVTGRRVCKSCGQTYHLRYDPPPSDGACTACGGEIYQRSDDTEEKVRTRDSEYQAKTAAVLAHYDAKGVVAHVNGVGELDEITQRIREALRPIRPARREAAKRAPETTT